MGKKSKKKNKNRQNDANGQNHGMHQRPLKSTPSSLNKRRAKIMNSSKPGKVPKKLPIEKREKDILKTIENNQVTIIVGNTGCGKSTKIPQMLYRAKYAEKGIIACTQPRRIAAWSLATRVAEEMKTEVGKLVGYKVRFEDEWSEETKILYLTDGSLVGASPANFELYSVIVIDEVHQRSILTDVLLGLLKTALQTRDDMRVILSSATINSKQLSQYFNNAPILEIEGSPYDVWIHHLTTKKKEYLGETSMTIQNIAKGDREGDILVFLPGKRQIDAVNKKLVEANERNPLLRLHIVPAHAELAWWQLKKIYKKAPDGMRKVILSTNMAETSLTIENVVFVVDSGFVNIVTHEGRRGINHLSTVRCSRTEAMQRLGRAGRTQNGVCYRLYSEEVFKKEMPEIAPPEIGRLELSSMILKLKSMKIEDVRDFDFLEKPNAENLKAGHDNLHRLRALDSKCKLTRIGRLMSKLPIEPNLAASIIKSTELGCTEEVLTICSVISAVTGVFGLDVTSIQGGIPFVFSPTVATGLDLKKYERRLKVSCQHYEWPRTEEPVTMKKKKDKNNVLTLENEQLAVIEKLVTAVKLSVDSPLIL